MTILIYAAALCLSYFVLIAHGLGISLVTLSKNSVYRGEPVTLTCSLVADNVIVLSLMVDCINATQNMGALFCNPTADITFRNIGVGLFSGFSFDGCSSFDARNTSLSVSIIASPSWELDYRCTFAIFDSSERIVRNITSPSSYLSVIGMPEIPKILPNPLVFNEMSSALVICESRHGKPPADLSLTVRASDGTHVAEMGTELVSLNLSLSFRWQNATALCNVTNHNASGITTVSPIIINYIFARYDSPLRVNTYSSSQTLDCSADISSFPSPSYKWWIPRDANVAEPSPTNTPFLTIPQGRSGFFVCMANNNATSQIALAMYDVTNVLLSAANPIIPFMVALTVLIVVVTVITGISFRARGLSKRSCLIVSPAERHGQAMCISPTRRLLLNDWSTKDVANVVQNKFSVYSKEESTCPMNSPRENDEEQDASSSDVHNGQAQPRPNKSNTPNAPEPKDDSSNKVPEAPTYQSLNLTTRGDEQNYAKLTERPSVSKPASNDYIQS